MSNELSIDRNLGLRVGYLVQHVENCSTTGREGVLRAIHRTSPAKHFRYKVEWKDDGSFEEFSRKQIVVSRFANFPHWQEPQLAQLTWQEDDSHVWILFHLPSDAPDFGSCYFCGQMRQYMEESNERSCRGPVKVAFR